MLHTVGFPLGVSGTIHPPSFACIPIVHPVYPVRLPLLTRGGAAVFLSRYALIHMYPDVVLAG